MSIIFNANASGIVQTVDTSSSIQLQTANTAAVTIGNDQNITFNSTGAIILPSGTTAQRPSAANGAVRYNTTLNTVEFYSNGSWASFSTVSLPVNSVAPVISGSTVVGSTLTSTTGTWSNSPTSYGYQWRANATNITNATSSTFVLTSTQNNTNITCNVTATNKAGTANAVTSNSLGPVTSQYTITYLIVAGGGGGGFNGGGGGGAGGLLTGTTSATPGTSYSLTVGAGGVGQVGYGTNGGNSGGFGLTSIGGGGGGSGGGGSAGGSGGGQGAGVGSGGAGTAGQGNNGGGGNQAAGGGGGRGAAGADCFNVNVGGNGGIGYYFSITGQYYAGGGGGGSYGGSGVPGSGGAGGGANGTAGTNNTIPADATANTGGGGGGQCGGGQGRGGNAGSGVVIVAYAGAQRGTGGTVTSSGGNTIHTFTSSGTYVA